ncbi:MAG: hypothetical protein Kow0089_06060 [Desulfobulbaceae bacterium]
MMRPIYCLLLGIAFVLTAAGTAAGEERYLITTRDGHVIVARDYRFTEEYVEFTTENGLPGFIKRDQFASISNMVGEKPRPGLLPREEVDARERTRGRALLAGGVAVFLLALSLAVLLTIRRRKKKEGPVRDTDIFYGRTDMSPVTQGHLSFAYRGFLGRVRTWTIDVRDTWKEDGILFLDGICTATEKRKVFRSDRIVGQVRDMSSERVAAVEQFFVPENEEEG